MNDGLILIRRPFRAMGSPCEIQLFAAASDDGGSWCDAAIAEVERLEAKYSRYRETSFLSEINRVAAAGGTIAVDDETASLLDYAAACAETSSGLFDITSGLLRQAWDFRSGRLADPAAIERLLPRIGWTKVRWKRSELTFTVSGMEIDFGGVVKEYAVDCVATLLRNAGATSGFVNLGGDIGVLGPRPRGQPWRIAIRHHRVSDAVASTVEISRGAMATSGDYERCIVIDGRYYGHILDPRSGWPVEGMAAVSVVANLCVVAGSCSTIAMLKQQDGPQWLAELGLPHRWTTTDGRSGGTF